MLVSGYNLEAAMQLAPAVIPDPMYRKRIEDCAARMRAGAPFAASVAKARLFTQRLALPEASSPIVPVILGSAESALAASARLEAQGFLVVAIRPPTVPEGMARLRIAFSAAHYDDDVIRLADAIVALLGGVS